MARYAPQRNKNVQAPVTGSFDDMFIVGPDGTATIDPAYGMNRAATLGHGIQQATPELDLAYPLAMLGPARAAGANMAADAATLGITRGQGKRFLQSMGRKPTGIKPPKPVPKTAAARRSAASASGRRSAATGGKEGRYIPAEKTQIVPKGPRRNVGESREIVPAGPATTGNQLVPHATARASTQGPAKVVPPTAGKARPRTASDKMPRQTTGNLGDDIVRPAGAATKAAGKETADATKKGIFDKFGNFGKRAGQAGTVATAGGIGYAMLPSETKNTIREGGDIFDEHFGELASRFPEANIGGLPGYIASGILEHINNLYNPETPPIEASPADTAQVPSPEQQFTDAEIAQMTDGSYTPVYDTYEQQFRASPYGDMVDEMGNPIEPEKGVFDKFMDVGGKVGNRLLNAGLAGQGIDPRYGSNANELADEQMKRMQNPVPYEAADMLSRSRQGDLFGDMQSQYMDLQRQALELQQLQSQGMIDQATKQAELKGIQMQRAWMEKIMIDQGMNVEDIYGQSSPANLVITDDMLQ